MSRSRRSKADAKSKRKKKRRRSARDKGAGGLTKAAVAHTPQHVPPRGLPWRDVPRFLRDRCAYLYGWRDGHAVPAGLPGVREVLREAPLPALQALEMLVLAGGRVPPKDLAAAMGHDWDFGDPLAAAMLGTGTAALADTAFGGSFVVLITELADAVVDVCSGLTLALTSFDFDDIDIDSCQDVADVADVADANEVDDAHVRQVEMAPPAAGDYETLMLVCGTATGRVKTTKGRVNTSSAKAYARRVGADEARTKDTLNTAVYGDACVIDGGFALPRAERLRAWAGFGVALDSRYMDPDDASLSPHPLRRVVPESLLAAVDAGLQWVDWDRPPGRDELLCISPPEGEALRGWVTPSFEVIVEKKGELVDVVDLVLFLELIRLDTVATYKLTAASVKAGIKAGGDVERFKTLLASLSASGLPPTVAQRIEEWSGEASALPPEPMPPAQFHVPDWDLVLRPLTDESLRARIEHATPSGEFDNLEAFLLCTSDANIAFNVAKRRQELTGLPKKAFAEWYRVLHEDAVSRRADLRAAPAERRPYLCTLALSSSVGLFLATLPANVRSEARRRYAADGDMESLTSWLSVQGKRPRKDAGSIVELALGGAHEALLERHDRDTDEVLDHFETFILPLAAMCRFSRDSEAWQEALDEAGAALLEHDMALYGDEFDLDEELYDREDQTAAADSPASWVAGDDARRTSRTSRTSRTAPEDAPAPRPGLSAGDREHPDSGDGKDAAASPEEIRARLEAARSANLHVHVRVASGLRHGLVLDLGAAGVVLETRGGEREYLLFRDLENVWVEVDPQS